VLGFTAVRPGSVWKIAWNRAVAAASYSGHNMNGFSPSSDAAGNWTRPLLLEVRRLTLPFVDSSCVVNDSGKGSGCKGGYLEYEGEISPRSYSGLSGGESTFRVDADEYCSVWSRSHNGSHGAETRLTGPAVRLSKSCGVGGTDELER